MQYLNDVWLTLQQVWHQGVFGLDLGQWLIALVIMVLVWLGKGLFSHCVVGMLRRWVKGTKNSYDDALLEAFHGPLTLLPLMVGVALIGWVLQVNLVLAELVAKLVQSLFVAMLFWGFHNSIDAFSGALRRLEKLLSPLLVDWLLRALRVVVIFLAVAVILEVWGIAIGPILAGLGLFGVAVALGAQDMFKNLFAGLLILAEKRFSRGDWVKAPTVEGTVEHIGFRSTKIRQFDKAVVYVPNVQLADAAVVNFSEMTHRRISWMIGVEYRSSADQLRQIVEQIKTYVTTHEDFASPDDVSTFVRVDSFGPSSIDIFLYCFTKTTDWGAWLQAKERLALKIKEIVEGAGTGFAFPSRTVYIENNTGVEVDAFTPPAA